MRPCGCEDGADHDAGCPEIAKEREARVIARQKGDLEHDNTTNQPAGGFAQSKLRSFVERVERLEEEKKALATDIKEVYSEAKGQGFDTKIMRKVIILRRMDKADREEAEALLALYMDAVGG